MTMQVDFWQLLMALAGLVVFMLGILAGGGRMMLSMFEAKLDQRFEAMNKERATADNTMQEALRRHTEEEGKTAAQVRELENTFLNWKADLPLHYVRREDYVRNQTVIEAKIDRVYEKLEVVQLQGAKQ